MNMAMKTAVYLVAILVYGHCSVVTQQPLNILLADEEVQVREICSSINYNNRHLQNISVGPDKYIAGGHATEIGQFPWMACLYVKDRSDGSSYLCSGSLIGARYVLTAAHCINMDVLNNHDVKIYLGEYNRKTFPVDCVNGKCIKNKLVYPDKIIKHSRYNSQTFENDIALLRLEKRAPLSAYIQPVPLPPFDLDHEQNKGAGVAVLGWGETPTLDSSNVLLSTEISLIPKSKCLRMDSNVPAKHLCAGDPKGKDTCPGDSGGPLLMYYKGKYYVAGVVSYGPDVKCGTSKLGFYTNVFKYRNWIKKNMKVKH